MPVSLIKNVNFGRSKGGLSTVGFTLIAEDGTEHAARTTTGVYEIGTSTGIYGANISFDDNFKGSILWDTGEGVNTVYAAENHTGFEADIRFIKAIEGGRWRIDARTKEMFFYSYDDGSLVAKFKLLNKEGAESVVDVFERRRLI